MSDLIPSANVELVKASEAPSLLLQIRPAWQARDLITRVKRLVSVDPSSACQRLFNAAIHDLREKVVVAGIDIAKEAAKQHKLPPVERAEDIEEYSTAKLIDLAHRMVVSTVPKPVESCRFENHGFAVFLGAFSSGLSASVSSFFRFSSRLP
jgi:hypothetical protein